VTQISQREAADEHVMAAEGLALEVLGAVPPKLQDGFVFHAMQVFGDQKYQNAGWSLTDRLELLCSMMAIPGKIGMAICLGLHWRGSVDFSDSYVKAGMSPAQADHFAAFHLCIGVADRSIRKHAGPREVAAVVAEDVPEMRKYLKIMQCILRDNPTNLPQEFLRETVDVEAGYIVQKGELRVSRIRNSVHFVEKAEDPLVQVADACA
jgi:hypothetical protein